MRAVVVAVVVAVVLAGAGLVGVAMAQTPTPTPDTTPNWVWGCTFYPGGAAPVCTWGDYFEIEQQMINPSSSWWYDHGNTATRLAIVPPVGAKSLGLRCQYVGLELVDGECATCATDLYTYRGKSVFDSYVGGTPGAPSSWTSIVAITITRNTGLDSTIPDSSDDYVGYFWFGGFVAAKGKSSPPQHTVEVYQRMACEVTSVQRMDGTWYTPPAIVPSTPTPGPTVTPGSTPGFNVTPWISSPWVNVPPGERIPVELGVTPGETECLTLLPAMGFPDVTISGNTYSMDFAGVVVCLEEYEIGLQWAGINWGSLVITIVALGGLGLVFTVFKRA